MKIGAQELKQAEFGDTHQEHQEYYGANLPLVTS